MAVPSYKTLLEKFGTIDMLPSNPFYILGLPCEASPRQIRRRREDLEAAYELGSKSWNSSFPYLLKGSAIPNVEVVKDAFARLEDVEERVVASFFWFWEPPANDGTTIFNDAFHAFISGDFRKAEEIWKTMSEFRCSETGMLVLPNGIHLDGRFRVANIQCRQSIAAKHNLLLLYKLQAVLWELQEMKSDTEMSSSDVKSLDGLWAAASEKIEPIYGSHYVYVNGHLESEEGLPEGSWSLFQEKMTGLNDVRLSEHFLSALKLVVHDIPLMWHVNFIRDYAKTDKWADVNAHIRLAYFCTANHVIPVRILDVALNGMRESFRVKIERLDQKVKDNPSVGLAAANELIDATMQDYNIIYAFLGDDDSKRKLIKAQRRLSELNLSTSIGHETATVVSHGVYPQPNLFSKEQRVLKHEVEWRETYLRMRESLWDPVVKACFNYLFKYSEATKDWKITIEWDEFLGKLAVSDKLKAKISDDSKAIFKIQVNELLERFGIQVKSDAKKDATAVNQLIEEFKQLVMTIDTKYGDDSEFSHEVKNQVAQACRNFSIAYGNATNDWEGCIQVLKSTREFITDSNLLAQLDSDFKILTENQRLTDEEGRCWVCHGRSGVADHEIKMHGNERRDIVSNQVTWAVRSIKIPLCSKCRFKYYGLHLLVLPMSVGLGSLIGFIVGTIMDTSRHGQMGQDGACIGAFLGLGLAILLYWGGLIRWLWFRKYPAVLEAKRNGFSFGEWPSGIT